MSLHIEQRESEGIVIPDLKRPLRKAGGRLALLNLDRTHRKLFLSTKPAIAVERVTHPEMAC
ncbi:MAG: hypothetical protein ABSH40_18825 [Bryobacteraceae bacterium]